MPENVNPEGTQGQGGQPSTQNNPQGSQQPQEPAWIQHVPEQHREEAKKSYLLHSDYTKKTTDFSEKEKAWQAKEADYEKQAKEYADFQKQYVPFKQKLEQHWEKIAPILAGQQQVPVTQQQQNGYDQWENWDVLPPQEQAKRLIDHINNESLAKQFQAMKQEFAQTLAQREQGYQAYMNILTDAFGRKFQNPELDLQGYMKKALDIQAGKENPMDLAYTAVTSEASRKALEEQFYKKGREDRELEYQNQHQTNGALGGQTIPMFKQTPLTREQVADAARQVAVKKGYNW